MSETTTKMARPSVAMKAAHDDFAQTFAAFKSANDERLSEIEHKQSADAVLVDKVERINSALSQQEKRLERLSLNMTKPGMSQPGAQSEVKSAWETYIRRGDTGALSALEGKSLTAGVDA